MGFSIEQLKAILAKIELKANHEFDTPPTCLEINGEFGKRTFATLGNFSVILARHKVGKSTFSAIGISSLLSGNEILNFVPTIPSDRKIVLWFDTEQGKPEAVSIIRTISKLVNGKAELHPENLIYIPLRSYNKDERLQIIEFALEYYSDVFFVVIDGIRDLVSAINNEDEANLIVGKLMKWTEVKNIHILTVLHQNKGDSNARGHLGSELVNKSEIVVSLEKDIENGTRKTIVKCEDSRHKEFENFAYSLNEDGTPYKKEIKVGYQPENPKVDQLTTTQILSVVKEVFKDGKLMTYKPLYTALQEQLKKIHNISFGIDKAKDLVVRLKNDNYIRYYEETKTYQYYIPN